jgi:uncharacterized protein YjeT (DUF2065 family)
LWERVSVSIGVILVLLGLAFVVAPIIAKHLPTVSIERIPWILLWVYHKDSFWVATSPILIIAGAAYVLWRFLVR